LHADHPANGVFIPRRNTAGKALASASFASVAELKAHIETFIDTHNETAKPFAWQKSEVHQKLV
jgi:hypothetical protein